MNRIDIKIRALFAELLTEYPKITVCKATDILLEKELPPPVKRQLEQIKFLKENDEVKDYFNKTLSLPVNDTMNEHLILYNTAYDDETYQFKDDFKMLNKELREWVSSARDEYPEASSRKLMELAERARIPGAGEVLRLKEAEFSELIANSSV